MTVNIYRPTLNDALSAQELDLYHLIMAYRAEQGLPAIALSSSLTLTAGRHAVDTYENIWLENVTLPPGANLHSWSDAFYYDDHRAPEVMWEAPQRLGTAYPGNGYEISAAGYTSVEAALEGWKGSPGHNTVIVNEGTWSSLEWNAIGVGIEYNASGGPYGGKIYHVWFGSVADPAGGPDINGTAGNDSLIGTAFDDRIFAGDGDDTVRSGDGDDTVWAGDGNDIVTGGNGRDVIYLEAGDDQFFDENYYSNNLVFGGDGNDRIWAGGENDTVFGGNGRDVVYLGVGDDLFNDNSELMGDLVFGGHGNDTLQGGNGDDSLHGEWGNDRIFGRLGNDQLFGDHPTIHNGDRDGDWLHGGDGFDTIYGHYGHDTVFGGNGRDVVFLGWHDDLFNDNAQGGYNGADFVYGGRGNDTIQGGNGNDMFNGEWGDDRIFARKGDDKVIGGSGNDMLDGGAGNDTIDGGSGDDWIYGGSGADTLVFGAGFGRDVIGGFEVGIDTFELDATLWTGTLSAAQVVAQFASVTGGRVVFDFGADEFTLEGVTTLTGLENDLVIV